MEWVSCGRKEKLESKIGKNLSLEKREKGKMPVRRRNSTELKDNRRDNNKWFQFQDGKPGRLFPNESAVR
jgi:hypothetical protein